MKQTNPVKAIRDKCLDCCGNSKTEVEQCPVEECALFAFRLGKNPYRKPKNYTEEQRAAMAERAKRNFKK